MREPTQGSLGVVWLTGLPASGKSTIAARLTGLLQAHGITHEWLDGDAIRALLPTGFSRAERDAHVRSVGFLASRLERHGVTVVVSMVSPFREPRLFARGVCERFTEIHVATSLVLCEARDPKGLYAAAREGKLSGLTGVDSAYETPISPELIIDTETIGDDAAAVLILALLLSRTEQ